MSYLWTLFSFILQNTATFFNNEIFSPPPPYHQSDYIKNWSPSTGVLSREKSIPSGWSVITPVYRNLLSLTRPKISRGHFCLSLTTHRLSHSLAPFKVCSLPLSSTAKNRNVREVAIGKASRVHRSLSFAIIRYRFLFYTRHLRPRPFQTR